MCLKYRESGTRAQLQQLSLHSSPHPEAFSSILCLFSLFLLHATIHPSLFTLLTSPFILLPSFPTTYLLLIPSSSLLPLLFLQTPLFSFILNFPPPFSCFSSSTFFYPFPLLFFIHFSLCSHNHTPLPLLPAWITRSKCRNTVFHPKCDLTVVWWNTDITGWHDRDIIPNLGIWHHCC